MLTLVWVTVLPQILEGKLSKVTVEILCRKKPRNNQMLDLMLFFCVYFPYSDMSQHHLCVLSTADIILSV